MSEVQAHKPSEENDTSGGEDAVSQTRHGDCELTEAISELDFSSEPASNLDKDDDMELETAEDNKHRLRLYQELAKKQDRVENVLIIGRRMIPDANFSWETTDPSVKMIAVTSLKKRVEDMVELLDVMKLAKVLPLQVGDPGVSVISPKGIEKIKRKINMFNGYGIIITDMVRGSGRPLVDELIDVIQILKRFRKKYVNIVYDVADVIRDGVVERGARYLVTFKAYPHLLLTFVSNHAFSETFLHNSVPLAILGINLIEVMDFITWKLQELVTENGIQAAYEGYTAEPFLEPSSFQEVDGIRVKVRAGGRRGSGTPFSN